MAAQRSGKAKPLKYWPIIPEEVSKLQPAGRAEPIFWFGYFRAGCHWTIKNVAATTLLLRSLGGHGPLTRNTPRQPSISHIKPALQFVKKAALHNEQLKDHQGENKDDHLACR